jgi:hypothetical protein
MTDCGVRWGATITQAREWRGDRLPEWCVTVESEPLAAPLGETLIGRFAAAAALVEPSVVAGCARAEDRLALLLTVRAADADAAADSAARAFERALTTALWPRYQPSGLAEWRVRVEHAGALAAA